MSIFRNKAAVVAIAAIILIAVFVASLALFGGCGDDGTSTDTRGKTVTTAASTRTTPKETPTRPEPAQAEAAPSTAEEAVQATGPAPAVPASGIEIDGAGCSASGCRGTGEYVGTANPGDPILYTTQTKGDVVAVKVIIVNEDTGTVVGTMPMVSNGVMQGGPYPGWTVWQAESVTPAAGHYYFYMEAVGADGTTVSNGPGSSWGSGMPMYVG